MQWTEIIGSVIGGLVVALLSWFAARAWARRRTVPLGLNQYVPRRRYLSEVRRAAQCEDVHRLDAMLPNLRPAHGSETLRDLQNGWAAINERGRVRVVVQSSQDSLVAGAELLARGIEVRGADADRPEDCPTIPARRVPALGPGCVRHRPAWRGQVRGARTRGS
ncbi:hypothetical protein Aglo01_30060 [Actinokineospora globicatena]|nr:hypothetical protein Aglo01_30060 [Actinokineospora globicatena]GLW84812.1 hypothetical protein Aglo02_24520 [Actinokineospora globicatena]